MKSAILGVGRCLPPTVEVGGVARPIAAEPEGVSKLAAAAVPTALEQAGRTLAEVDFVVFSTWTPDVCFPGAACYLQAELGLGTTPAVDLRAQCAGFLFGLGTADPFVRAGVYRTALLAAGEIQSAALDYSPARIDTAVLFGDGAGVAVLGPAEGAAGVHSVVLGSDGRRHREFWCEHPSSRQYPRRMTKADFDAGRHYPSLDRERVRECGEAKLPAVMREALAKAGRRVDEVDRWIVAHVFPDVAESAARELGIGASSLSVPSARHGHLGAGAIPVALAEDWEAGRVGRGATVGLAACGAGVAWGAAVVTL